MPLTVLPSLRTDAANYATRGLLDKAYENLKILFTDLLPSNISFVIPNAIFWAYRTICTGSIQCETLATPTKTANLYTHNVWKPKRQGTPVPAILLLHGEQSHPLTMLHLADIAKEQGRAVFSVYLPYDDNNPEDHRSLLNKSINKIDEIITRNGGSLSNLLLAGHSRGSIEAASEAFVENNPKINGVIAIAGRFKVIEPSLRPCRETLKSTVNAIWERLGALHRHLRIPFYQIAAIHDWCIDPEASLIRRDQEHLSVNASHLSVLYHPDTLNQFRTWVAV